MLRSESVDLDSVTHCLFIACINRRRRLNFQPATEPASLTFWCDFRGFRGRHRRIDDGPRDEHARQHKLPFIVGTNFRFCLGVIGER